jgi:hypothetical protein
MIHFLLGLALVVGITIATTLFVQHQRDRRAMRQAIRWLEEEPAPRPTRTPWWGWAMAPAFAVVALVIINLAR